MSLDSRITLHKLEVLDAVVEMGGVSRAAEHLLVAQPVVTAHIRSLERRLGVRLFYRDGRQLRLTETGQVVHSWATDVLARTDELSRHLDGLSDGTRGSVVVGASMSVGSYILPPVAARFKRSRPLVDLQLAVAESDVTLQATEAGRNDFAVLFLEQVPASAGLEGEPLGDDALIFVAAPGLAGAGTIDEVEDLAALPFIDCARGTTRRAIADSELGRLGLSARRTVLEVGHPEAMKRAAEEGLGYAMVFRSSVRHELEHERLCELLPGDTEVRVPVYLVRRRGKLLSAIQRDLIAAIQRHLTSQRE